MDLTKIWKYILNTHSAVLKILNFQFKHFKDNNITAKELNTTKNVLKPMLGSYVYHHAINKYV